MVCLLFVQVVLVQVQLGHKVWQRIRGRELLVDQWLDLDLVRRLGH
jgi:hypothetical protein